MTSLYIVHAASTDALVVRRYMDQGPFTPAPEQTVDHNGIKLAVVSSVTDLGDNTWTLTLDRRLPYILIGTILGIGRE